jgi:UDP-glucose:(heptosyl)LPS alpha-1,3-glucosyltransferase
VFLLPTLYDPFSNACLEACAAGLPVITTDANGFSEIMESGRDGEVLADPDDIAAIMRAVEAWRDPARRLEARARLPRFAAQYDIATNVGKTLEVVERARPSA